MLEVMFREQAKSLGLKRYFTGIPCLRGHLAERRIDGGGCLACDRKWRQNNGERLRAYRAKSLQKHGEKWKAAERHRYAENAEKREHRSTYGKEYYQKNRVAVIARTSASQQKRRVLAKAAEQLLKELNLLEPSARPAKMTPQQRTQALARAAAGTETIRAIARSYGVSSSAIYRLCLPPRKRTYSAEQKRDLHRINRRWHLLHPADTGGHKSRSKSKRRNLVAIAKELLSANGATI